MDLLGLLLIVFVALQLGVIVWVALKNIESDRKYDEEIDRIYGRKK